VIATFYEPADPNYDPERLFELMWREGYAMFRGRLTAEPTFRIGCMGAIDETVMREVVRVVTASMKIMGVRDCRPAAAPAAAE
jgi:2-aminoethylphosphonate-pyruvate transaminase